MTKIGPQERQRRAQRKGEEGGVRDATAKRNGQAQSRQKKQLPTGSSNFKRQFADNPFGAMSNLRDGLWFWANVSERVLDSAHYERLLGDSQA